MDNLVNTLHDIKDRCFVYSIMLTEASSSLGKMKIMFKMPAIFISLVLSVVNSSKLNESDNINIVNTILNAFIALLIGVENTLQLDNKRQVFTSTKNKFEKLHSNIEKRLLDSSEPLSIEFVQNAISEFEQIDDDLTFDIPKSICKRTKTNFVGKRTLPLILGGDKATHEQEEQKTVLMQQVPLQTALHSFNNQAIPITQPITKSAPIMQTPIANQPIPIPIRQSVDIPQIHSLYAQQANFLPELDVIRESEQIIKPINVKPLSSTTDNDVNNANDASNVIDEIPEFSNMSI